MSRPRQRWRGLAVSTLVLVGVLGAGLRWLLFHGSTPFWWMPPALVEARLHAFIEAIDAERMLASVRALSAGEYEGRHAGSPGNARAAQYLSQRFAELGLQPVGNEGFFQTLSVPYAEFTATPTLVITLPNSLTDSSLLFAHAYRPVWGGYAGGGSANGRIYWLDDGDEKDYEGLGVTDQIALVKAGLSDELIHRAATHGVSGLLIVTDYERWVTRRFAYWPGPAISDTLPVLLIMEQAAGRLFEGTSYTTDSLPSEPSMLATSARFEVPIREYGDVAARNILGAMPGRETAFPGEVIILGAHYDHIGLDPNGDLYAGANDNASGVAVLLEVARVLREHRYRPSRTILFALWDGEEQDLLGAQHYVRHPVYPLDQTLAMIQLDMVGVAAFGVLTIDGVPIPQEEGINGHCLECRLAASAQRGGVSVHVSANERMSDHEVFRLAGVPTSLLIWDDARVPYYHTPADVWTTLQPQRMRQVAAIVLRTLIDLAEQRP